MTTARTRPSRMQDLRLVVDYLRAIRNEATVDEHTLAMAGVDPSHYGKLPRPSRWITHARRLPVLSRVIHWIGLRAWQVLGPLFYTLQSHRLPLTGSSSPPMGFDPNGQVLGLSPRTIDIVHARNIDPLPRQWLELPWIPLRGLPEGAEVIRALDLLNAADLDRSMRLARTAHRIIQRRRDLKGWGLQTYTAWRWFLARLAIDKLPGPLLTVEHFDRWAVLVDSSVWASRMRQAQRRLTMMQHGSVNAETPARALNIKLPTRLRGVHRLHVYSPADEAVFRQDILSGRCQARGVIATYFRPMITLTAIPSAGRPTVLFVGHPLCAPAHMTLLAALLRTKDVQTFYKPHPTTGAGREIQTLAWTVIKGRSQFPDVDLIVSYPSTMVAEYAEHGIPAVVHPMDIPPEKIILLIPEVIQKLDEGQPDASRRVRSDTRIEL